VRRDGSVRLANTNVEAFAVCLTLYARLRKALFAMLSERDSADITDEEVDVLANVTRRQMSRADPAALANRDCVWSRALGDEHEDSE
jgi:hypothetical protein